MKQTNGLGPMSAGAAVPSVKRIDGDPGEHPMGTAMHPGFDHTAVKHHASNAAKHKAFMREPVPKTPRS